jgi:hypothetical protein
MTIIKFSKAFGEVEVINQDENFTTIVVLKTGEQKKLSTKYANLSDEPFAKAKKIKSIKRELTQQEKDIVARSVESQMREQFYINGLNSDQKLEYKANKSKRIHLS